MIYKKRGCYTVKTYQSEIYTWCPDTTIRKKIVSASIGGTANGGGAGVSCTATPNSQGYDPNVKYVFEGIIIDGLFKKLAYVECDYVM